MHCSTVTFYGCHLAVVFLLPVGRALMYPEEKYKIGVPGASWQELLYDVNLAPVWKALDELNRGNQFRFFPMMARYSKAFSVQITSHFIL